MLLLTLLAWTFAAEVPAQVVSSSAPDSAGPAPGNVGLTPAPHSRQATEPPSFDLGLEEIVVSLEKALPPSWHIASLQRKQIPRKWQGPAEAVFVRLEDASMVLHHTNGFEYHPFYKLWLCPRN